MAKQTQHHGKAWYVIHTYSGYEDNVARNLKQRIESMDMQDLIFDVMVPKEKKIKIKNESPVLNFRRQLLRKNRYQKSPTLIR